MKAVSSTVLLNLLRFHSPLSWIAAFPFTLVWMFDRCDNHHNTSSVHCWTTVFALPYSQHPFRHAVNWMRSSTLVWLQTQLRKMFFFCLINTCPLWKEERRRGFLLADPFTIDEWREFYCLHEDSCCCLKKLRGLW